VDHVLGGRLATEYLLKKGYKKIVFVGSSKFRFSQERCQGYEQAMQGRGLSDSIWELDLPSWDSETASSAVEELIWSGVKFDAVFGCLDYIAIGALKALLRNQITVPKEVGVIGYDNIVLAEFSYPELTTVAQPKEEMGILSVKYLLEMIQGKKMESSHIFLQPRIVERASC